MADGTVDNKVNNLTIKDPLFFKHAQKPGLCTWRLNSMRMIQDPGEDPYQEIKDHLIQLYSHSNYQKFEALINLPFTSDTTPSVLMSSMLNMYPNVKSASRI